MLAGGKSPRMGTPKAVLRFGARVESGFDDIVVAAPEQEQPVLAAWLVRDEVPFQGPVVGIYYGLNAATSKICFATFCDAPFLNLRLIRSLLAALGDADVTVPFWQSRLQPLQAVYRRSVMALLERQLDAGKIRPTFLYEQVKTRIVAAHEVRAWDPEGLSSVNLNTPEDYQQALRR